MKHLIALFLIAQSLLLVRGASAQANNWQNSPNNWNNSPNNWSATNGVYDNGGKRIGYETQSPSGVTNVFDNNGNRIGYSPAGSKP
jgi:hypothetical protein